MTPEQVQELLDTLEKQAVILEAIGQVQFYAYVSLHALLICLVIVLGFVALRRP